jgi:hypothetical protein
MSAVASVSSLFDHAHWTSFAADDASDVRGTHLGIRLTARERRRLREVARRFPAMPESAIARIALLAGLDVVERDGIPAPRDERDGS